MVELGQYYSIHFLLVLRRTSGHSSDIQSSSLLARDDERRSLVPILLPTVARVVGI
jgi:hypothetical protein